MSDHVQQERKEWNQITYTYLPCSTARKIFFLLPIPIQSWLNQIQLGLKNIYVIRGKRD